MEKGMETGYASGVFAERIQPGPTVDAMFIYNELGKLKGIETNKTVP
jgi:hypothetical protein